MIQKSSSQFKSLNELSNNFNYTVHPKFLEYVLDPFSYKHCDDIVRNHMNADIILSIMPSIHQYFIPEIKAVDRKLKGYGFELAGWIPSTGRKKLWKEWSHSNNNTVLCQSRYFVGDPQLLVWNTFILVLPFGTKFGP